MKEIEQFKKENGNVNYTVKELVQGLHGKIDKNRSIIEEIKDKLSEGDKRLTTIETNQKWHKRALGGLYTLFAGLLLKIFTRL